MQVAQHPLWELEAEKGEAQPPPLEALYLEPRPPG